MHKKKEREAAAAGVLWAVCSAEWQPEAKEWEDALALVPEGEQQRIGRFIRPRPASLGGPLVGRMNPDAKASLLGRLMMRRYCHDLPRDTATSLCFGRTQENKPYCLFQNHAAEEPYCRCHFNLSHGGEWVVFVGTSQRNVAVGIDVMKVEVRGGPRQDQDSFFHDLRNCFTDFEWSVIKSGGTELLRSRRRRPNLLHCQTDEEGQTEELRRAQLVEFYKHWVLKESYIKAVGIGLGFSLRRAEFHLLRHAHERTEQDDEEEQERATLFIDGQEWREWSFKVRRLLVPRTKQQEESEAIDKQKGQTQRSSFIVVEDHVVAVAFGPLDQATQSYIGCTRRHKDEDKGDEEQMSCCNTKAVGLFFEQPDICWLTRDNDAT
ncbi:L-aminoadipate-semialdehyde dehydrogenase-phosphopantetheinyl transferase [Balamuthia mandrillaris]